MKIIVKSMEKELYWWGTWKDNVHDKKIIIKHNTKINPKVILKKHNK